MQRAAPAAVLAALCWLTCDAARRGAGGILTGEFVEVSHCKAFKENAMFINPNVSQIRTASGEYYVSGSFNISRASRAVTKAIVTLDYCSQNVGKRCEHFQTWRYGSDSCTLWQSKNTIWTQFVDSVQPRYTCPFQAGEYNFNNLSFDYKLMQLFPFPVEDKEWTITVDVFGDRTEHWLCGYGIVKFSRSQRSRGSPGSRREQH